MANITDPRSLRPTLGREGWCQRVLTELILEAPYPPYNTRRRPSERGAKFLGGLDELCFGADEVSRRRPVFVDEIDFPARHPDEKGCAPDYTVFVGDRCWIIELKTEPGSHRPRQVPDYFERARHHHPDLRIDLTYLTGGLRQPFTPPTKERERYAHLEWHRITGLITSVWSKVADPDLRAASHLLLLGLEHLEEPVATWWTRLGREVAALPATSETAATSTVSRQTADGLQLQETALRTPVLEQGIDRAEATAVDGRQRALGVEAGGLEALQELRLALHRACRAASETAPLHQVRPWLWSAATSGGKPMTPGGQHTGYEIRLSRLRSTGSPADPRP